MYRKEEKTLDEKMGDMILDMKERWYKYNEEHGLYYDYDCDSDDNYDYLYFYENDNNHSDYNDNDYSNDMY